MAAILRLTRTRDFVDPELALAAGGPPFTEPTTRWFAGEIPEAERLHALGALRRARAAVAAGRWEDAWHDLHGLPLPADSDDGRDLRLLYGFVLYKTLRLAEATSVLETLAERPDTVTRRPAVLYYLGRVKYGDGRFQRGTQLLTEFARRFPALVE